MKKTYKIGINDSTGFQNNALFCVGTGRMGLALRHDYHKQLEMVQKDIGFSYIRGHGLFCDDMAIYHTYKDGEEEKEEYNFQYVDLVFDDYLSLGIKPFVELGFMPGKLASGEQTIFYWKGNTTPPKDYDKWSRLVAAAVSHWIERYGIDEVLTWPIEVWNEPNLGGFWKDADMDEYFKLYETSARAVKSCDKRIRVGGPSICGVDDERWLKCFLEFCSKNKVPLDFVTRHAYGTEMPEWSGRYVYQKLRPVKQFVDEMHVSRGIIDSFPEYKGMEMHITEYNTSYNPRNPIHDTNLNAAYVAAVLSQLGDTCASYSYWTFGDVFEEMGVAFTPFSGCFGLLTNIMVPKPTYRIYEFYKLLHQKAVMRDEHSIVTISDNKESLRAIAWHPVDLSDNPENPALSYTFEIPNGTYCLIQKIVDEETCNPLKAWVDIGSPAYPSKEQTEILLEASRPQVTTSRVDVSKGSITIDITLSKNAVHYFELLKITPQTDRGFDTERITGLG